jgi:Single-strand binding protein family
MHEELPVSHAAPPQVKDLSLPVLPCPVCGVVDTVVLGPGAGKHVARALCSQGHFIKWLPKALVGGEKDVPTMDSLNVCIVSGVLERDPTMRYREAGTAQCTCTLRLEEARDGTVYNTYVLAEAYGKTAEVLADLQGGAVVVLQGKLFWRKQQAASGADKSGLALLVQKVGHTSPQHTTLTGNPN